MPIKKLINESLEKKFSTGNEDFLSEAMESMKNSESVFASKTERRFKDYIDDGSKTCKI
jgi:hypothetical protein